VTEGIGHGIDQGVGRNGERGNEHQRYSSHRHDTAYSASASPDTHQPATALHSGEYQDSSSPASFSLYWYQNDPNGCPVRLLSSTGEVLWAASYTAWAEVDLLHAALIDNPIRLQGQYADAETGLSYNRHRYFCPHAGQFISQDPLGLAANTNLYTSGANTAHWLDPLGLTQCSLEDARRLAQNVPAEFKQIFKCKEFANSLKEGMQRDGLHAEEIILKSDTGLIFSDAANKVISTNGDHVGIKVGDQVFDNLNPQGIHIDDWARDLGVGFPGMRPPKLVPF
jgi:RHS repeat-associated protein